MNFNKAKFPGFCFSLKMKWKTEWRCKLFGHKLEKIQACPGDYEVLICSVCDMLPPIDLKYNPFETDEGCCGRHGK